MTDDYPWKSCDHCQAENHLRCQWLTHHTDCGCACSWLQADMRQNFPSLRQFWLEENDDDTR